MLHLWFINIFLKIKSKQSENYNILFTRLLFGLIILLSSVGISIMGISRKLIALNNTLKTKSSVDSSDFWSIGKILKKSLICWKIPFLMRKKYYDKQLNFWVVVLLLDPVILIHLLIRLFLLG